MIIRRKRIVTMPGAGRDWIKDVQWRYDVKISTIKSVGLGQERRKRGILLFSLWKINVVVATNHNWTDRRTYSVRVQIYYSMTSCSSQAVECRSRPSTFLSLLKWMNESKRSWRLLANGFYLTSPAESRFIYFFCFCFSSIQLWRFYRWKKCFSTDLDWC